MQVNYLILQRSYMSVTINGKSVISIHLKSKCIFSLKYKWKINIGCICRYNAKIPICRIPEGDRMIIGVNDPVFG